MLIDTNEPEPDVYYLYRAGYKATIERAHDGWLWSIDGYPARLYGRAKTAKEAERQAGIRIDRILSTGY